MREKLYNYALDHLEAARLEINGGKLSVSTEEAFYDRGSP